MISRIRRLGLATALAVAVAGLVATAAQACTLPWTRTPNDGIHYFAGAIVTNQAANQNLNGADAHIFINDPTLHSTYYTDSWVGIQTYDSGGEPVLVQDGYMKFAGGNDQTFYQICSTAANGCFWTGLPSDNPPGPNPQNVTVGSTYDFNVYSQVGNAYFDFAGVLKATVNLQQEGATGITSASPWDPVVEAEPASYGVQMPGTSGNHETFTSLQSRRWCGSNTCWDGTGDQGWATSGTTLPAIGSVQFDLPMGDPGGVSQTRVNNSFKNAHDAGPNIEAWDTCTTS